MCTGYRKKIAILGGGPGGLSAAYYLQLMGHQTTVYEMLPKLGGMLRYGIPNYRLPKDRLDDDIRADTEDRCAGEKWSEDRSGYYDPAIETGV